jgi:hypothetical protein
MSTERLVAEFLAAPQVDNFGFEVAGDQTSSSSWVRIFP